MKLKEIPSTFWTAFLQFIGIHEQQNWYEETEIAQDARGWYLTADPRKTRYESEREARKVAVCNCYKIKEACRASRKAPIKESKK